MTTHTIRIPDWRAERELRTLVWDDEAGTVGGDYSEVDDIRRFLEDPEQWTFGDTQGVLRLEDPRHKPEDFKGLLSFAYLTSSDDVERTVWPPTLADVVPTPPALGGIEPGAIP